MGTSTTGNSAPKEDAPITAAFEIVQAEHSLEVVDRRSMTFRSEHKFSLIAQIPSRFFIREYYWTGSGAETEPVPELITGVDEWGFPHHRIHGPLLRERNARILVVDLGRTLMPGETVDLHFRHQMKDLLGTFVPTFVARPSRKIRNRIALRLVLPPWTGLRVTYHRFTHDTEKVVSSSLLKPVNEANGKLTFEKEIANPSEQNMGHRLEWSHDEA